MSRKYRYFGAEGVNKDAITNLSWFSVAMKGASDAMAGKSFPAEIWTASTVHKTNSGHRGSHPNLEMPRTVILPVGHAKSGSVAH